MAYVKLDETLKEAFLKHRRGVYDQELDGRLMLPWLNGNKSESQCKIVIMQMYNNVIQG